MEEEVIDLARELDEINAQIQVCRKQNDDLKRKLSRLKCTPPKTPLDEEVHFNDALLYNEMARRKIALRYLPQTSIVEAKYQSHVEFLFHTTSRSVPYVDTVILENKFHTKQLLKEHGYSTPEGNAFGVYEANEALEFAREQVGYPVVIKPVLGSGGNLVHCNIQTDSDFRRAYSAIGQATTSTPILVEKFHSNVDDYRFLLIDEKVISVVKRTPPVVIGNGRSTLLQLVEEENTHRMNPRKNCLCSIQIDDWEGKRCLASQGFTQDTILANGQKAQCRWNANVLTGGECETVTRQMHPSYNEIVKNVHQLFPNLSVFVVDLLIQDSALPAEGKSHWICECCCILPGLSLHTHPSQGVGDDIISPLVDSLFPETAGAK